MALMDGADPSSGSEWGADAAERRAAGGGAPPPRRYKEQILARLALFQTLQVSRQNQAKPMALAALA
jgi:hypothetical protein